MKAKETKTKRKRAKSEDDEAEEDEEKEDEADDDDEGSGDENEGFENEGGGDEYILVLHSVNNKRASHMMGDKDVSNQGSHVLKYGVFLFLGCIVTQFK